MSREQSQPPSSPPMLTLNKQRSWTQQCDAAREEAWLRRCQTAAGRRRRSMSSLTDDDVDELKGCVELGLIRLDDDPDNPGLSELIPALQLYHDVNDQYNKSLSRTSSAASSCSIDSVSDVSCRCPTPTPLLNSGDDPETVKKRLRRWAQLVGVSVRYSSSSSSSSSD